ncbi:hypothetical protein ACOSQ2_026808 [Xanthoceras sorbifolium]
MATLKITKKHHKHLNNPFPSTPRSLPFIQGTLLFNSQTLPSQQIFSIGEDFQLLWSSDNGGYLSISHYSNPTRSIWSTIPGQAFVSAALAETEVEESRGSYVFKDRDVRLVCDHQTIEDIRVINQFDHSFFDDKDNDYLSGYLRSNQNTYLKDIQFPVLLITGWIFATKMKKRLQNSGVYKGIQFETKGPSAFARYWILFDQKNSNQVGFHLKLGQPNFEVHQRSSPTCSGRFRRLRRKLRRIQRRKFGWCLSTRPRGFVTISSSEEDIGELKVSESPEFNRVCLTFSSERNERFYGFGEQFSHMDFKGKRVPIFVQEQGIGRGDQPISFAANLVSYR